MTFDTQPRSLARVPSQPLKTRSRLFLAFLGTVVGLPVFTVVAIVAIGRFGPRGIVAVIDRELGPDITWTLRIDTKNGQECWAAIPLDANGPNQEAEVKAKHLPPCDPRVIE